MMGRRPQLQALIALPMEGERPYTSSDATRHHTAPDMGRATLVLLDGVTLHTCKRAHGVEPESLTSTNSAV